jgi:adenylate kinase
MTASCPRGEDSRSEGHQLTQSMVKIIVMGAPGGQGDSVRRLSERFGYPQISTGDILREMAKAPTALGAEIKSLQSAGKLRKRSRAGRGHPGRTQPDSSNGHPDFPRTSIRRNC